MTAYVPEEFTSDEADILRRYFTNLDGPVFALVNLPEVVKGALFARYSRSPKSLRRLFLDEFVGDLDITGDQPSTPPSGFARAEELYEKVFFEYGDDSVAQLGGVHLACEQASNMLTKVLEWGRLMSYLEQSTRYIAYDARLGGRYRYYRDPAVLASRVRHPLRRRHGPAVRRVQPRARQRSPITSGPRSRGTPTTATSCSARRRGRRRSTPCAACCRRRRCRTSASTAAARRSRRCCCGCGPPAAGGTRLRRADAARAAQGDPELPAPRRRRRARRALERSTSPPRASARPSSSVAVRRHAVEPARRRSRSSTGIPTRRTSCSPRSATRTRDLPEHQILERVRRLGAASGWRSCGRTSASARTAGTSRAGRSSGSTTASTCCPTTARSATCSAIGC